MPETVVSLKNINKRYWLSFGKQSLIGSFLSIFTANKGIKSKKEISALKNIELCIKKGEAVGIIGENASGKTTILRIISRITAPSDGQLQVYGKVAGLLDLGAGLHGELTGKENIYLDSAIYGKSRREIDDIYEKIVEFSGLGDFVNAQVKTYSQGMLVRLGFAIAIHVEPDIFLIDDSLAVGDEEFQRKCLSKVLDLKEQGKTIIVVSHDLDSISRICERGILLKSGRILKDDSMHKVILRYVEAVGDKKSIAFFDKGRLSLIFNSGKIILLWDGKPITKSFGGYISLQILDKWAMSWQGKWKVVESTDDSWKVSGSLDRYGVKLELGCLLEDERMVNFILKIEIPKQISLKKTVFGFMLSENYDRFLKEESIELIENIDRNAKEWADIYRTDEYSAPLTLISRESMPVLNMMFSQKECSGFSLIQNTTKELNARIMQTQMSLSAGNNSSEADSSIECSCRLELLKEEDFQELMRKRIQDSMIESSNLKVQLRDKDIQIFHKGIKLTNNEGLNLGFYYKNRFSNLFSGLWSLKKKTADSLSVYAQFKEMGLNARFSLRLSENSLNWQFNIDRIVAKCPDARLRRMSAEAYSSYAAQANEKETSQMGVLQQSLDSNKGIDGCRLITRLYLSQKYKKYFSGEKECEFSAAGEHAEKIDLYPSQTDFVGLKAVKDELPLLVFESGQNSWLGLQNAGIDSPGRILLQETIGINAKGRVLFFHTSEQKNRFLIDKKQKHAMDAVLGNDQLRLEFDEKNINIYRGDSRITAGEGFSSGVYLNGRWYESTQLKKQITKQGNALKVLILRRLPQLSESWEISLEGEEIHWVTKIQSAEKLNGLHYKAGIVLNSDYGQWAHSFNEGQFKDQAISSRVIDLDDVNNALLGARSEDRSLPAIFFKIINSNTSGVIIQKEENKCCLQFKSKKTEVVSSNKMEKIFSGSISFHDRVSWSEDLLNHRREGFSLETEDGLRLFAATEKITLQAKGKDLTQAKGLAVSLLCDGRDIDTNSGSWTLKKNSPDQIDVHIDWADAPLSQKWQFERVDNSIQWIVLFDVKRPVFVRELLVNIFPQKHFNRWQTKTEDGKIVFQDIIGESVPTFDNRSEILRIFPERVSLKTPGLALNLLVEMEKWFLHIYNHDRGDGVACGVHYLSDPKGVYLEQGINEIFKGRISLVKDINSIQTAEVENSAVTYTLEFGRLKVRIEKAKMRLFWAEKELTKKLGMFTAFFVNNNWFDSTLARWDVQKVEPKKIEVCLSWSSFSFFQIWEIKLVSEYELVWNMRTEIKQTGISLHAASIMISEGYERYKSDDKQASSFPDRFEPDAWVNMAKIEGSIEVVSTQNRLPALIFDAVFDKHAVNNILDNSDVRHSARVLRCEMQNFESDGKTGLIDSAKINILIKE